MWSAQDLVNTPERDKSIELDQPRLLKNIKGKSMQLLAKLCTLLWQTFQALMDCLSEFYLKEKLQA